MPTLPSPKTSQTHHVTLVGLADNWNQRQNEHFLVKSLSQAKAADHWRASENSLFSFTWDLKAPRYIVTKTEWLLSGYSIPRSVVETQFLSPAARPVPHPVPKEKTHQLMVWQGWQRKSNICNHFGTLKTALQMTKCSLDCSSILEKPAPDGAVTFFFFRKNRLFFRK